MLSSAMFHLNRMMKNKNFNFSFPYKLWLISQQSTVNITNSWASLSLSHSCQSLVHLMLIIIFWILVWSEMSSIIIISIFMKLFFYVFHRSKIAHCHTWWALILILCFYFSSHQYCENIRRFFHIHIVFDLNIIPVFFVCLPKGRFNLRTK